MNAIHLQKGCGKGRDPWSIRKWLAGTTLENMVGLARAAGQRYGDGRPVHPNQVSETLSGLRNDKRVLNTLEDYGCPSALLYPLKEREGRAA